MALAAFPPLAADEYTLADQRLMAAAERYFAWQARLVGPYLGRRVLEVGCGAGNFSGHLRARPAVLAVDRDPACLALWRRRHGAQPNFASAFGDLAADSFLALAAWRPDTAVCLNVLEHLADDHAALGRLTAVLAPGGRVIVIVPAFPSLFGPVDRALGHHRRYTRAALGALAAACGLRAIRLHYWNLAGFFAWWINARLLPRAVQSSPQIALFDRLVVPLARPLESLVAPPFGQSLLAVLEKVAA